MQARHALHTRANSQDRQIDKTPSSMRTHTHCPPHTYTPPASHTHCPTHTHPLPHTHTSTVPHLHIPTPTRTPPPSHTRTHLSHTHPHRPPLHTHTPLLSHTHTHTPTVPYTHRHTHTCSFSSLLMSSTPPTQGSPHVDMPSELAHTPEPWTHQSALHPLCPRPGPESTSPWHRPSPLTCPLAGFHHHLSINIRYTVPRPHLQR